LVKNSLSLQDIFIARRAIAPYLPSTPLMPEPLLSHRLGCQVYLKLETRQPTGSFKVRGALYRLMTLDTEARQRGVVTASAGNHALGVAYAARTLGDTRAVLFLPTTAPRAKVERLRLLLEGTASELRFAGESYDEAHVAADAFAREQGLFYVSAYDDALVVAGQGTVGLELMADLPEVEAVLVPVGGGGLIAGVAVAVKAISPRCRVIGVQPEASPAALLSLQEGCPYETYPAAPTIADGLAGGFGRVPFQIARDLIDEIILVSEEELRAAVFTLLDTCQELVEGAAAASLAPLLSGKLRLPGQKVALILTGRNIDTALVREILDEH